MNKIEAFENAIKHAYGIKKQKSFEIFNDVKVSKRTSRSGDGNSIFITFEFSSSTFLNEIILIAFGMSITYVIRKADDKIEIEFYN